MHVELARFFHDNEFICIQDEWGEKVENRR